MTSNKTTDPDHFELPPDAKCLWGTNVERFASIDDENDDPEGFLILDDTCKRHCVESCECYAAFVSRVHGAELTVSEVGNLKDRLSIRFNVWPHEHGKEAA